MTDDGGEPIRVFLVDDQEMVRAGFRMLIDSQDDLDVVGEAGDGGEAVQRLAATRADVVLMDVRMPRLDGVEATRLLAARADAPRVIVLTTFDLDEYAFAAIKAGAAAFLLKDAAPHELLHAIRAVHAGDAVVAPSTTRRLLEHFAHTLPDPSAPSPDARLGSLTDRELEVLTLVGSRPVQPGDRRGARRRGGHRQDPRRAAARQDRLARPRPARRPGLRDRHRGLTFSPRVRPRSYDRFGTTA